MTDSTEIDLALHIPPRPHGTAYNYKGKYLMRSGEALVPMTEDRLRKIFAEGQPNWLEEPSRSGLSAQEVVECLDTQTYFEMRRLPYPADRAGVLDRLKHDRLIDLSHSKTYSIRRMGALVLARRLEDFPDVARKAPRLRAVYRLIQEGSLPHIRLGRNLVVPKVAFHRWLNKGGR